MKQQYRVLALAGCLLGVLLLAACGGPSYRPSPFDVPSDVPSGVPGQGYTSSTSVIGVVPGRGGIDSIRPGATDEVSRAAAEIAASTVFFDFDKSAIRPDARLALDRAASLLKRYPSIRICLHGHCDARGPNEYNYYLGERRARAVYGYLTGVGVPPVQLEMVTHGKKTPALVGGTESVYAKNRRVELIVMTTCY